MIFQECKIGWLYQDQFVKVFFGNNESTIDNLKQYFNQIDFRRIKQTHSDICVISSDQIIEADAHVTDEKSKGLIVATADCMPILAYCPMTKKIAAIHAGWRGIVNQIAVKTLKKMIEQGAVPEKIKIWLGPHILQHSFEVNEDVMNLIKQASDLTFDQSKNTFLQKADKYEVNLFHVLKSQLEGINVNLAEQNCLMLDTKTNPLLHSYRRDQKNSGRNLSFISLT